MQQYRGKETSDRSCGHEKPWEFSQYHSLNFIVIRKLIFPELGKTPRFAEPSFHREKPNCHFIERELMI